MIIRSHSGRISSFTIRGSIAFHSYFSPLRSSISPSSRLNILRAVCFSVFINRLFRSFGYVPLLRNKNAMAGVVVFPYGFPASCLGRDIHRLPVLNRSIRERVRNCWQYDGHNHCAMVECFRDSFCHIMSIIHVRGAVWQSVIGAMLIPMRAADGSDVNQVVLSVRFFLHKSKSNVFVLVIV